VVQAASCCSGLCMPLGAGPGSRRMSGRASCAARWVRYRQRQRLCLQTLLRSALDLFPYTFRTLLSIRHILSCVAQKSKQATVMHACGAGGAGLVRAILAEALGLSASALGGVQVVLTGACDAAAEQPAGALVP